MVAMLDRLRGRLVDGYLQPALTSAINCLPPPHATWKFYPNQPTLADDDGAIPIYIASTWNV